MKFTIRELIWLTALFAVFVDNFLLRRETSKLRVDMTHLRDVRIYQLENHAESSNRRFKDFDFEMWKAQRSLVNERERIDAIETFLPIGEK